MVSLKNKQNIYVAKKVIDLEIEALNKLFQKADICINLVGILYESGKNNTFKNIHTNFPDVLSKLANLHNLEQFIHVSALGIDEAETSVYAKSKVEGEKKIKENFPRSLILRPSIVYSVDDNFTTLFMTLINRLPIFPIYYNVSIKCTENVSKIRWHVLKRFIGLQWKKKEGKER